MKQDLLLFGLLICAIHGAVLSPRLGFILLGIFLSVVMMYPDWFK